MNIQAQIKSYISGLDEPKRIEMDSLHQSILQLLPNCRLWFFDGKNGDGKADTNPTIGYGLHAMKQANGKSTDWFKIGLSANKGGISVYILGIKDKNYLAQTYAAGLGKATVTGYCIKFKTLKDINLATLKSAIQDGYEMKG